MKAPQSTMSNPFDTFQESLATVVEEPQLYETELGAKPGERGAYRELAEAAHKLLIAGTPNLAPYLKKSSVTHSVGVMAHYIHMGTLRARQDGLTQPDLVARLQHPDTFAPLAFIAEQPLKVAGQLEHTYGIKASIQYDTEVIVDRYYGFNDSSLALTDLQGQTMSARLNAITRGYEIDGRGCPAQLRGILHAVHNLLVTAADTDERLIAATLDQ